MNSEKLEEIRINRCESPWISGEDIGVCGRCWLCKLFSYIDAKEEELASLRALVSQYIEENTTDNARYLEAHCAPDQVPICIKCGFVGCSCDGAIFEALRDDS